VFLITKQLYILHSFGADGHWNGNELKAPVATRWRLAGQNWPVGYRMSTTGWIQSNFCDSTNVIFLLQTLSDFIVDILNVIRGKCL